MKRFSFRFALVALSCAMTVGLFGGRSPAVAHGNQAGTTLLKASVIVRANRLLRYWKAPDTDN